MTQTGKHQRQRMVGNILHAVIGNIGDLNACGGRRIQIDILKTDTVAADDLAFSQPCNRLGGHRCKVKQYGVRIRTLCGDIRSAFAVAELQLCTGLFQNGALDLIARMALIADTNKIFCHCFPPPLLDKIAAVNGDDRTVEIVGGVGTEIRRNLFNLIARSEDNDGSTRFHQSLRHAVAETAGTAGHDGTTAGQIK